MPIDADGNRADMIMDGISVNKRMNPGQLYEQYINATGEHVRKVTRAMVEAGNYDGAWKEINDFYAIASPRMHAKISEYMSQHKDPTGWIKRHVDEYIADGHYIWLPANSPNLGPKLIVAMRDRFPLNLGPVTYRGSSGIQTTTKDPVLIGSKYMILLDSVPDRWGAVSTAKLQHFGFPAKITETDKYSTPTREQPVRVLGETEVRSMNAIVGSDITAYILDQSNNPQTHKAILRKLLHSDHPTNIDHVIPPEERTHGGSRTLSHVRHLMECSGIAFSFDDDDEE